MNIKKAMKHWKHGAIDKGLWSDKAQRGTVLIDTNDEAPRAVLVDDHGGIRAAFQVPPGQIGEVIGAAAEAWHARGAGGSFAVYSAALKGRGVITPPPPPPPGPGGHERILILQTRAAHTTFDVAAELVGLAEAGGLDHVTET